MDFNTIRELYKTAKKDVLDHIKIKYVDGAEVREQEIDFCMAGNGYRFPNLIPKDEIWIEDVYRANKLDLTADLIHELVESTLMARLDFDYDHAHDLANVAEKAVRKSPLSKRAALERSGVGIGVSITVRKKWREYYKGKNLPSMQLMDNKMLNDVIGADFLKSQVLHRFLLKSGDVGEFRKSNSGWLYLGAYRGGKYDVITIQQSMKETTPELSRRRMTSDWLETGHKHLLERKTRPGA
jgi:hypothetical protein